MWKIKLLQIKEQKEILCCNVIEVFALLNLVGHCVNKKEEKHREK